MKFIVNSSGPETNFNELKDPAAFLDSNKKREILIEKARYKEEELHRHIRKIRTGNKVEKQKKTLANINKLFDGRNDVIKFLDDYGPMILEAERKASEKEPEPKPEPSKSNCAKIAK